MIANPPSACPSARRRVTSTAAALLVGTLLIASSADLRGAELRLELPQKLSYGETVLLRVSLADPPRAPSGSPKVPQVAGLRITGPHRQGRNYVNTRVTYTWDFHVQPQATRKGKFRIGPATLGTMRSGIVQLTVD